LVACALASFALLFAPGYRRYRYLSLPTSAIAPITVYVDAENINLPHIMDALIQHLRRDFLQGSRAKTRADLLFFMDSTHTGARNEPDPAKPGGMRRSRLNWQYEALYRSGFRLVDSPHNPTGQAKMAEAVDREIAMHALERALVGGGLREFVIVSGDGDYAPLIYRLIALGHQVQVWMWGQTQAYREVAHYLPLTVHDLSASADAQGAADAASATPSDKPRPTLFTPRTPPVVTFSPVDINALYYAIDNTLELCETIKSSVAQPSARLGKLNAALGDTMKHSLIAVGYAGKGSSSSWLRCLSALHALRWTPGDVPAGGTSSADDAARQFFKTALAAAQAASRAVSIRADNAIGMAEVI
ncbi:MAG: NYN domain-containing protein, partial [Ktedonobacteraceae bacterium]